MQVLGSSSGSMYRWYFACGYSKAFLWNTLFFSLLDGTIPAILTFWVLGCRIFTFWDRGWFPLVCHLLSILFSPKTSTFARCETRNHCLRQDPCTGDTLLVDIPRHFSANTLVFSLLDGKIPAILIFWVLGCRIFTFWDRGCFPLVCHLLSILFSPKASTFARCETRNHYHRCWIS